VSFRGVSDIDHFPPKGGLGMAGLTSGEADDTMAIVPGTHTEWRWYQTRRQEGSSGFASRIFTGPMPNMAITTGSFPSAGTPS
jgi:hypothetical protein